MENGFGLRTMDNRSKVTAAIIVAFAILYDYYLLSGALGWFIDTFYRKAYIYSCLLVYVCPLIYLGNSNKKTPLEIAYRQISSWFFGLVCLGVILNNLSVIRHGVYYSSLFCTITLVLIFLFIFKADKNGNI